MAAPVTGSQTLGFQEVLLEEPSDRRACEICKRVFESNESTMSFCNGRHTVHEGCGKSWRSGCGVCKVGSKVEIVVTVPIERRENSCVEGMRQNPGWVGCIGGSVIALVVFAITVTHQ